MKSVSAISAIRENILQPYLIDGRDVVYIKKYKIVKTKITHKSINLSGKEQNFLNKK